MESASAFIDQKIKELGDWRGKMLVVAPHNSAIVGWADKASPLTHSDIGSANFQFRH